MRREKTAAGAVRARLSLCYTGVVAGPVANGPNRTGDNPRRLEEALPEGKCRP